MEKIGAFLEEFLSNYGVSFLVMVFIGFGIAFLIELGVKKAFKWLEEKLAGKDKMLAILNIAKMSVIFIVTIVLTLVSTHIIMKGGLPLPGNAALAPFWFLFIYIVQYVFSMYGIKGILGLKNREKAEKPKKEKPAKKDPLEGLTKLSANCYTDNNGHYFNKKGKEI